MPAVLLHISIAPIVAAFLYLQLYVLFFSFFILFFCCYTCYAFCSTTSASIPAVFFAFLFVASIGAIFRPLPALNHSKYKCYTFRSRLSAGIDAICSEALTRERRTLGRSERPLLIDFLHIFLYFAHVYDYVYVYRLLAGTVTTKNSLVVVPSFAVVF